MAAQKVVVILDASRDVSWSAIRWLLLGLTLKPGDELTLLGVVHQVNNPMGYKSKVDSSSLFGSNPRFVKEEITRKMDEYRQNEDVMQLSKHCETEKIKLCLSVHAGTSPRMVALDAAIRLKATWVILDRQMKKDKKYFMEKLPCGISRIKRDNTIEQLRGPIEMVDKKSFLPGKTSEFSYGEMIPGNRKKKLSPKESPSNEKIPVCKGQGGFVGGVAQFNQTSYSSSYDELFFSSGSFISCSSLGNTESSTSMEATKSSPVIYCQEGKQSNTIDPKHETAEKLSAPCAPESREKVDNTDATDTGSPYPEEQFENSVCSVCNNRRPDIGREKDFTYIELWKATKGFSPENFLSEGGFGSVYKGILDNGLTVAVKQHKDMSFQGEKEFKSEVRVLSKARHQNLVRLLGSCSEGSHRLLVYEFVCNGSLDQHILKNAASPLDWDKRIKVALDAAKGLEYLHRNNIIHRDMRPNNILVTHDHDALLGDFGLAKAHYDDSDHSTETGVVGTLGYVAPEYAEYGHVSTKTDVYSFGVVVLQLITGMKHTETFEGESLVGWAKPLLEERNYPLLIDYRLVETPDFHQLFWMVIVARDCLHNEPDKRHSMAKVVEILQSLRQGKTAFISPTKSSSVNRVPKSPDQEEDARETKPEVNSNTEEVVLTMKGCTSLNQLMNDDKLAFQSETTPATTKTSSGKSVRDARKTHDRKRGVSQSDVLYNEMIN